MIGFRCVVIQQHSVSFDSSQKHLSQQLWANVTWQLNLTLAESGGFILNILTKLQTGCRGHCPATGGQERPTKVSIDVHRWAFPKSVHKKPKGTKKVLQYLVTNPAVRHRHVEQWTNMTKPLLPEQFQDVPRITPSRCFLYLKMISYIWYITIYNIYIYIYIYLYIYIYIYNSDIWYNF